MSNEKQINKLIETYRLLDSDQRDFIEFLVMVMAKGPESWKNDIRENPEAVFKEYMKCVESKKKHDKES